MNQTIFLPLAVLMALPFGIILECIYSLIYKCIRKINISHYIALKKIAKYKEYNKEIQNENFRKEQRFQELLSENNIIRNLWISSIFGFLFALIFKFSSVNNTIDETKILIWLPIIILFMWAANIRTEVLIKEFKTSKYIEKLEQKNKENK